MDQQTQSTRPTVGSGLTIDEYAELIGCTPTELRALGVSQRNRDSASSVRLSYNDRTGVEVAARYIARGPDGELTRTWRTPELALSALHHDSHEAYVCDIPSPLKRKLRDAGQTLYDEVCDAVDVAIHAALGLAMPSGDAVEMIKQADQTALMIEAADLLLDSGAGIAKATGLAMELPGQPGDSLAPDRARAAFLAAHERLSGSSQTDHRPL